MVWQDASTHYVEHLEWFTSGGPWRLYEVRQIFDHRGHIVFRLIYRDTANNKRSKDEQIWHATDYWFISASQYVNEAGGLEFWTQWEAKQGEWVDYTADARPADADIDLTTPPPTPKASTYTSEAAGQASGPPAEQADEFSELVVAFAKLIPPSRSSRSMPY